MQTGPLTYRKINQNAKSFGPGQPSRTARADLGRYFLQMPEASLYQWFICMRNIPVKTRKTRVGMGDPRCWL